MFTKRRTRKHHIQQLFILVMEKEPNFPCMMLGEVLMGADHRGRVHVYIDVVNTGCYIITGAGLGCRVPEADDDRAGDLKQ